MREPIKFSPRGNHHLYYGIFMIIFGAFNWFMGVDNGELENLLPLWQMFILVGSAFTIDDIIEHKVTADTPLRILYEKILRPIIIMMGKRK